MQCPHLNYRNWGIYCQLSWCRHKSVTTSLPLLSSAGRAQDCNCSTSNRYLEARGSIPRGETLLLHVIDMLYLLWLMSCEDIFFADLEKFSTFRGKWCLSVPVAYTTLRERRKERLGGIVYPNIDRCIVRYKYYCWWTILTDFWCLEASMQCRAPSCIAESCNIVTGTSMACKNPVLTCCRSIQMRLWKRWEPSLDAEVAILRRNVYFQGSTRLLPTASDKE